MTREPHANPENMPHRLLCHLLAYAYKICAAQMLNDTEPHTRAVIVLPLGVLFFGHIVGRMRTTDMSQWPEYHVYLYTIVLIYDYRLLETFSFRRPDDADAHTTSKQ